MPAFEHRRRRDERDSPQTLYPAPAIGQPRLRSEADQRRPMTAKPNAAAPGQTLGTAKAADMAKKIIDEVSPFFHASGSLYPDVLWKLFHEHQDARARVSVETGCGLSTLLLSNLSERHTAFTLPLGDSLQNTQNHPYLRPETTKFVVGPSQVMVPKWQFSDPVDFALIDGPHAYPFPDLEYYFIYPHIRPGGVLVVDDIHIPTIHRLYEFLRDDEMWEHRGDARTTAFFRRTASPIFDPLGDNWPGQRFNRRRFAAHEALEAVFGAGWYQAEFGVPRPDAPTIAPVIAPVAAGPDPRDAEIAALRAEVAALKTSTTWRATRPLRDAVDWARRRK